MAREIVLTKQENLAFSYSDVFGAFMCVLSDMMSQPLAEGEEYIIVWDDVEYTRTGFAFTNPADGTSCVAIGNPIAYGGENNGDSFAVVYDLTNDYAYAFSLTADDTHTVAIYQEVEETADPNDVSILNYSQNPVTYENVPKVWLTSADGKNKVPFSYGEAVDNVPIELDFSEGDQVVTAPDGTLVRSAIITKPEELIPENIAEGQYIAGVGPGTHSGGGGDLVDFMSEEALKYFAYKVDNVKKQIILCSISYTRIYADTGKYDVTVPDEVAGYSVIIEANF